MALEAYATGNRPKDAFKLAAEILAKNPNDLYVLVQMTRAGAEEVRKRNREHVDVSLQYGLKAIELVEAGSKRAQRDDQSWATQPASLDAGVDLAQLYQQTALLYLGANNTDEAKARLTKATTLSPHDPSNFALLGRVIHADYVKQMEAYKALPEGETKAGHSDETRRAARHDYRRLRARAGLAMGRQEYRQLMQQVIPDLTNYYKYRHNQSTKALQELINKYRR